MNKRALLIFAKNPVLGKAKTRLAATIGDQKALEVYRLLLNRTVDITQSINCDKVVFYSDFINPDDIWHSGIYAKKLQEGSDLGERISSAFAWAFSNDYSSVCIIGSDCYELESAQIIEAFESLEQKDLVIGPSKDGGYYLLGLTSYKPEFFSGISWSTNKVLKQTLAIADKLNLSNKKLTELSDVDVEEDLKTMEGFVKN